MWDCLLFIAKKHIGLIKDFPEMSTQIVFSITYLRDEYFPKRTE